ncbi:uncharacterized protein L969DRAFT_96624 [Mixia osmundae IAM 14324]|uniref:Peptidase S59 domain-containing protein n=1 Tax=Mixia osmundae (strain CBS 9802 / IAM 14324 / JCM 22182 / KY 12970) TaxID=764103 RepID=G7EAZ9_MIXOS|nr:uncharacterized protein L969DRAFT_96624 [Mixia osmundae IAM 14324]KEI37044.1 hypothetical protein L969DRAFT_96624 [Mixia osmundae IAM 14324]GAB00010.1 hypothetical protein E5Q_06712 [Mixia osmundae IAM 14324]
MSWGSGGFGSFGQQNQSGQQQQQQQQQTPGLNLFGQPQQQSTPSTFGSAFGQPQQASTSAFGQPAAPAAPTFGGFGAGASSAPAFGTPAPSAFGQPAQTNAFGTAAATPAAPSFSFGANTNQTNAFGTPNNTGLGASNAFGRPANTTGFGSTPFGQQQQQPAQTSLFGNTGASTGAFGAQAQGPTITTGTANPPYSTFSEKDAPGSNLTSVYQSIVAMPQYKNYSPEELRLQDYEQNRKVATTTGGFGSAGAFGAPSTGAFGATPSLFGQPAQQQQQQPASNPFGGGGGLFGQQQQTPATNPFGQPAQQQQTSLFGNPASTTSAFGQSAQNTASTGLFGQPATSQPGGTTTGFGSSLFGANNNNTSAFGQQNNQPKSFSFGSTPSNTLGQSNMTGGFGSVFGQNNNQQPATGFGAAATPSTGFSFGANNNAAKPAFGGFGTPAQSQPEAPKFSFGTPSTGLGTGQQNQQQSTGLFGQPAQQQQNNQTPSLFGGTGTSAFGGFGQQQQQQQNNTNNSTLGGGLFGTKPAAPSGGLFGAQPQNTGFGGSLFGAAQNQNPGLGNSFGGSSLFGGQNTLGQTNQQQQQQQNLQASVDQNPYGNNPLFANPQNSQPAGPQATPLFASDKIKPALSMKSSTPRSTAKITKLRGFASPSPVIGSLGRSASFNAGLSSASASPMNGRNSPFSLLSSLNPAAGSMSPSAFAPRPSIKKLTIDRSSESFLADRSRSHDTPSAGPPKSNRSLPSTGSRPMLDPDLAEAQARQEEESRHLGDATPSRPSRAQHPSTLFSSSPAHGDSTPSTPARKLKHGDYYTIPDIKTLDKLPSEELHAVQDFVVGREGLGKLSYLEPVDLTTLSRLTDIADGVVRLEPKTCDVYGGEFRENKPQVGEGLNTRAEITLYGCWPKDKATRQPIKDLSNPKLKKYINSLKATKDSAFVDYQVEDGAWIFVVEHFSIYGAPESEDDEASGSEDGETDSALSDGTSISATSSRSAASSDDSKGSQEDPTVYQDVVPIASLAMDQDESGNEHTPRRRTVQHTQDDDDDSAGSMAEVADYRRVSLPPPKSFASPWAKVAGAQSQRASLMRNSLFSGPPPSIKQSRASDRFSQVQPGPEATRIKPAQIPALAVKAGSDEPVLKLRKLTNPIASQLQQLFSDPSLSLARSFRAGWTADGRLLIPCMHANQDRLPDHTVKIVAPKLLSRDDDEERQASLTVLAVQLRHSNILMTDESDVPRVQTLATFRFRDLATDENAIRNPDEYTLWTLGQALFDEIELPKEAEPSTEIAANVLALRRRYALSAWLQRAVASATESDLRKQQGVKQITTLLSGYQIARACEMALDHMDLRLASLIAQSGGDDSFRRDLHQQLVKWRESRTDAQINDEYRRIFEILSANPGISRGSGSKDPADASATISVSRGLDWKRAFGLHLWYGPQHDAIASVLQRYHAASKDVPGVQPPVPWFAECEPGRESDIQVAPQADMLFRLIQLYVSPVQDLESVLLPQGITPSAADYRLSWHLYTLLATALKKRDFDDVPEPSPEGTGNRHGSARADSLCSDYASQLELIGLWQWAAFVLLHLSEESGRAKALKELLARNAADLTDEMRDFLENTISVPSYWIAEAEARLAEHENRIWDAYQLYFDAGSFNDAHRLAVSDLAPEAIIRDDIELLVDMLTPMRERSIADWSTGGQVFDDYLRCKDRVEHLLRVYATAIEPDPMEAAELLQLITISLPAITRRVAALYKDTATNAKHRACVSDMLSRLMQTQLAVDSVGAQLDRSDQIALGDLTQADAITFLTSTTTASFLHACEAT